MDELVQKRVLRVDDYDGKEKKNFILQDCVEKDSLVTCESYYTA